MKFSEKINIMPQDAILDPQGKTVEKNIPKCNKKIGICYFRANSSELFCGSTDPNTKTGCGFTDPKGEIDLRIHGSRDQIHISHGSRDPWIRNKKKLFLSLLLIIFLYSIIIFHYIFYKSIILLYSIIIFH